MGMIAAVPFFTAEKAWFWAISSHEARSNSMKPRVGAGTIERPCAYADVLTAAARMGLPQMEMKIIVKYGRLGRAPGKKDPDNERAIWEHAMDRLHTRLTAKGIVQTGTEWARAARDQGDQA